MANKKNQRLLIVGSVAFDSIETPAGKVDKTLGGSASYAALAAGYFTKSCVVGIVGGDFGEPHFDILESHGVDTRGIEKAQGETFHWKGKYKENFKERDTLETSLNVFENFNPVIPKDYLKAEYLFLGNIGPDLQARVLDQMDKPNLGGMDTMNFWIKSMPKELDAVLKRVDILFINDEEALELSEEPTILKAAEHILNRGPKYTVIKRGEYGAILFGLTDPIAVPAYLLRSVVDPTGAGDTFAGGFLGCMTMREKLNRKTFGDALLTGTVMASFVVEQFSVDGLCCLTAPAIQKRKDELEAMARF
jgi:sugar/nucleoside kinase (ribokinase family)